ncbi:MAG: adenine deaminase [Bacteroidetes bacterium]|nr:adenine deaminase [Bacteroidota bacterium]
MQSNFSISGQIVDVFQRKIFPGTINVQQGIIDSIIPLDSAPQQFILPGFVDAHVHIESSMLVPTEFARIAVTHGTVATVSDPHEIANVCGIDGVLYMLENAKLSPFKFFFGAPSCVPATMFESAGAAIDSHAINELLSRPDIYYLSEMMNYPGVLNNDSEVLKKIAVAHHHHKPIDGHAPGLRGSEVKKYAAQGITTDHECFTKEEALDKIAANMYILIREGSAANNFEALVELFAHHAPFLMFCSDDKHPDDLILSHINSHVKRAADKGFDLFDILYSACVSPVLHYKIPVGLLRVNDSADFIVLNDLKEFEVQKTYISGKLVAEKGQSLLTRKAVHPINHFKAQKIDGKTLRVEAKKGLKKIKVIEALEGQLITQIFEATPKVIQEEIVSDVANDILKVVVLNRYEERAKPAIAFIKNFGLTKGAIASTVAHDCHNIIAVGVDDDCLAAAINAIVETKGGISVAVSAKDVSILPLPIAGLMTNEDGYTVAAQYAQLNKRTIELLQCKLTAPFMTLSFMALLVIPDLKLSDKGLFSGSQFSFTDVQITA